MKKVIKYVFEKLVLPFFLSAPVITMLLSKFNTGQWTNYFQNISQKEWTTIVTIAFLIVIIRVFLFFVTNTRRRNSTGVGFISIRTPLYGWKEIGQMKYKGVIWKVKLAINSVRVDDIELSDIAVDTPPRCPKCKTEIEQQKSIFFGYVWECISCSFKIRNKDSYYREVERVEKTG